MYAYVEPLLHPDLRFSYVFALAPCREGERETVQAPMILSRGERTKRETLTQRKRRTCGQRRDRQELAEESLIKRDRLSKPPSVRQVERLREERSAGPCSPTIRIMQRLATGRRLPVTNQCDLVVSRRRLWSCRAAPRSASRPHTGRAAHRDSRPPACQSRSCRSPRPAR